MMAKSQDGNNGERAKQTQPKTPNAGQPKTPHKTQPKARPKTEPKAQPQIEPKAEPKAPSKPDENLKNSHKDFSVKDDIYLSAKSLSKGRSSYKDTDVLKNLSYNIGAISRQTVEGMKKSLDTDTCKNIGKHIGAFCNKVEKGWQDPDKIFNKAHTAIKESVSSGQILGSCAKGGIDVLHKTYQGASGFLGAVYKKSRMAALIAVWKIEHPGATKAQEQEAVSDIKKLFKS